jgi:hypothetical protein
MRLSLPMELAPASPSRGVAALRPRLCARLGIFAPSDMADRAPRRAQTERPNERWAGMGSAAALVSPPGPSRRNGTHVLRLTAWDR